MWVRVREWERLFKLVVAAIPWQSNRRFLLPAWQYAVVEILNLRHETTSRVYVRSWFELSCWRDGVWCSCSSSPTKKSGVGHIISEKMEYFDEETTDPKLMSASTIPLVDRPRFFRWPCPADLANPGYSILLDTAINIAAWISRPLRQSQHGGVDVERERGTWQWEVRKSSYVLFSFRLRRSLFEEYKASPLLEAWEYTAPTNTRTDQVSILPPLSQSFSIFIPLRRDHSSTKFDTTLAKYRCPIRHKRSWEPGERLWLWPEVIREQAATERIHSRPTLLLQVGTTCVSSWRSCHRKG